MFGRKKYMRDDLPAIDITQKPVKGFFGKTKLVPTSKQEQRKIKATLMERYPDRYFVDVLNEYNSVKPIDKLSWIDDIEAMDAIFDD